MDHNGNKALQHFCAILVNIVLFIYLYLLCNDNFLYFFIWEQNRSTYLSFSNNKLINKNLMPNRTIAKWFFVQRKTHFWFYHLVLRNQLIFQYLVNPPCCACDGIVISTMSPTHRYSWSLPSKHLLFLKTSSTPL